MAVCSSEVRRSGGATPGPCGRPRAVRLLLCSQGTGGPGLLPRRSGLALMPENTDREFELGVCNGGG